MRDDFATSVKDEIGSRVNFHCAFPECNAITLGPHSNESKSVNIGVAAHITAASPRGPRYDASLTPEERRSSANGIWLCQTHAKLIDSDQCQFSTDTIRSWKSIREAEVGSLLGVPGTGSRITDISLEEHRLDKAVQTLRINGEIKSLVDTFDDLTLEAKAKFYDKVFLRSRKKRLPKTNPYKMNG